MSGKNEIVQFRVDKALHSQLAAAAELKEQSVSSLARTWIVEKLRSEFLAGREKWQRRRFSDVDQILQSSDFADGPVVVIHAFPTTLHKQIEASRLAIAGPILRMKNMLPIESRINRLGYESFRKHHNKLVGFSQSFKTGQIEIVSLLDFKGQEILGLMLENEIVLSILAAAGHLAGLQIPLPYIFSISILRAKGYWLVTQPTQFAFPHVDIQEDIFTLPDVEIKEFDAIKSAEELALSLKDTFDEIWNASGIPRSLGFDKSGNWQGPW